MNDREFIELLNLYVDHEISPEDALRLEEEVASDPKRREVYDQYCRMQKACSMLSGELLESAASRTSPNVIAFPARRRWSLGPIMAGMAAAAACALVVVTVRNRSSDTARPSGADLATATQLAAPAPAPVFAANQAPMKPVFFTRLSSDPASARGAERSLFAAADAPAQFVELKWIGDVHMPPVFPSANADFLLNPRTDLKASAISETPDDREGQEPAEMAAFRFQR
jgi:hypothetical protein